MNDINEEEHILYCGRDGCPKTVSLTKHDDPGAALPEHLLLGKAKQYGWSCEGIDPIYFYCPEHSKEE